MGAAAAGGGGHLEATELRRLVEAVHQRYGYDFRGYAQASLARRVQRAVAAEGLASVAALQDRILGDAACMARFLDTLTVEVTALFRDPSFYRALREKVLPGLRDLCNLRVWCAGCATGEEVHSMAILLHEEGLLERTRIYATDLNERVLEHGRSGILAAKDMRAYTANYQEAGGRGEFSSYYTAKHEAAILRGFLRKNVVWSVHNLATDAVFSEFGVILCRNVMIYFGAELQDRVHCLLYDSLAAGGTLCLGSAESIRFTPHEARYETLDRSGKLYRKLP